MAFTISYKFLANDHFSKVSGKMQQSSQKLEKKILGIGTTTNKVTGTFPRLQSISSKAFDSIALSTIIVKQRIKAMRKELNTFKGKVQESVKEFKALRDVGQDVTKYVTLPIFAAGTASVISAAKLETMQVSFESMLGSAEKAHAMMEKLKKFSATTPFQLPDVSKSAKMLLSFGVAQADVEKRLRSIGDIAAGVNAPIGDLALIFGQVKAKGKLMNEEMLQFAERGVPILDTLAKGLGITKAQVQDMASKGKISFDLFLKAFEKTRELKFMNQMEKQSTTLSGKWSTLVDNIMLGSAEIGAAIVDTFDLKGLFDKAINAVQSFTENFKKLKETNPALRKTIVWTAALAATIGPLIVAVAAAILTFKVFGAVLSLFGVKSILAASALKVFALGTKLVSGAVAVMSGIFKVAAAASRLLAIGIMSISWPVVTIIAVIALVIGAIYLLWKNWDKVSAFVISASVKAKDYIIKVWTAIKTATISTFTSIKDFYVGTWTNIFNTGKQILTGLFNLHVAVWNQIFSFIGSTLSSISDKISNCLNMFIALHVAAWSQISNVVSTVSSTIFSTITSIWESIQTPVSQALNSVYNKVSGIWESITGTLSEKAGDVYNAITSPFDSAKEFLSGVLDSITKMVSSVIGKVQSVKNFFGDIGGNVSGFFKDKLSFTDSNVNENVNLSGETLTSNKSQTDINMTLNAPKGVVQDVQHKSSGLTNMNLGFNMVGAY